MLNILKMIILIIILFIIILLITGIKIKLEYTKKGSKVKGCLKILIFKKLKIYTYNFPSDKSEENTDEKKQSRPDYKKISNLAKPCLKDLIKYLKTVLKTVNITKIENHFIIGFESYYDTGKNIGIIWAILATINPIHEKLKLSAEPSFTGSVFDAIGVNEVDIYPYKLLIPTVRLISNKEVRNLIRGVMDER